MGMKQKLIILALLLLSVMFFACSKEQPNFIGYWQGEANMVFEVFTENGMDYTIRNINGDLSANVIDDTLRGKNSLDMEYKMAVKGDSAYYTFSGIVTGYARISKQKYDEILAGQQGAAQE